MTTRGIPAHFNAQQRTFLEHVRATRDHLFLRATAGAGKTTTLVEAAWHLPAPGVYFAYNKHAVQDLHARLPPRFPARTLHAHGLRLLRQHHPHVTLDPDKAQHVAALTTHGTRTLQHAAARAWQRAREDHHLTLTPDQAQRLADHVAWEGDPNDLCALIPAMHEAGHALWQDAGIADYTDLLWLPLQAGYGHATLPLALVDESQDLTPLRQAFVLHLLGLPDGPGRLIFVGDSDQAIYTWAGADPAALTRLKAAVGATELPLSVSFRCPREVVRYARAFSTFIQPASQAASGTVEHVSAAQASYARGDVVLCRTNAPLIRLALDLMTQQFSVAVTGRDLAVQLREALLAVLPAQGTFANDDVTERVRAYLAPRATPLQQRAGEGDRAARRRLTELHDLARCVRYLAWVASRRTGEGTLAEALTLLGALCREDREADVQLASIHRAKGKEWPRVTVLYPEGMPLSGGDPEEERAVQFVAVTRAQGVLRFAYGQDAWASGQRVQPGVLEPERPAAGTAPAPSRPVSVSLPGVEGSVPRPASQLRRPRPPAAASLMDERPDPLLGGVTPMPPDLLRERLQALAEEDRPLIRDWAEASLALLRATDMPFVGVHLAPLELYERAARQARLALPALYGAGVAVCVFEQPLPRVRLARKVRVGKRVIRLALGQQELRFDPGSGELLEGQGPLSSFILPAALHALRAG